MNSVSIPHLFFFQFHLPCSSCSLNLCLTRTREKKDFSVVGFNVSEDGDYCANSLLYKPVPAGADSHYSSINLKSPFPLIFMAWWLEMRRHLGSTLSEQHKYLFILRNLQLLTMHLSTCRVPQYMHM